jgi:hypothetical protein
MTAKEDYTSPTSEYQCINYDCKLECKSCDSYGRNLEKTVNTQKCYMSAYLLNNRRDSNE